MKLGLASAVVLAAAGGVVALLQPAVQDGRLLAPGRAIFRAVGQAVLEGSLPADAAGQQQALAALLERVDALVAALPPHAQDELSQLLGLLASSAGRRTLAGLDDDWAGAPVAAVQQALQAMRVSGLSLRRQAYQALHDITSGAYFSDQTTWGLLGYPGPRTI